MGITRLDGARGKKQVWRPHVRTWDLSEANELHCGTCDIVGTFGRRSQSLGARGIVPPCSPVVTPLITARSDAPQQTIVLSSNQKHTGTFGSGEGQNFQFVRIFEPLWRKRIWKFCRAMMLLKQIAQTYREVVPEIFWILPESSPYLVRL